MNSQDPAGYIVRKRKLFIRYYPFSLLPERDDCDQGAYFDEDDELDDWDEYGE